MPFGKGFHIKRERQMGYFIKVVILPLLTRIAQKQLQIGTRNEHFGRNDINNIEQF